MIEWKYWLVPSNLQVKRGISGTVCFCDPCLLCLSARLLFEGLRHDPWLIFFEDLLVHQRFRSLDGDGRFDSKKNLVVDAGRDTPLFIDKMFLFTRKVYATLPKAIVVYHRGGV